MANLNLTDAGIHSSVKSTTKQIITATPQFNMVNPYEFTMSSQPITFTGIGGTSTSPTLQHANPNLLNVGDIIKMTVSGVLKEYQICPGSGSTTFVSQSTGTAIGNMTTAGGLAAAFNSVQRPSRGSNCCEGLYNQFSAGVFGYYVGKSWATSKIITRFILYSPTDEGFKGDDSATPYKLQGSNDGTNWTTLYSGTTPSGMNLTVDVSSGITTSSSYLYHAVFFSGNGTNNIVLSELEFYESNTQAVSCVSNGGTGLVSQSTGAAIGNLTIAGGLSTAFNGVQHTSRGSTGAAEASGTLFPSGQMSYYIGKSWTIAKTINRFILYSCTDEGFKGDDSATPYKLQGSNDGTNWTTLYSGTTPSGMNLTVDVSSGITTTNAYTYHAIFFSGNGTNNIVVCELEFYEQGGSGYTYTLYNLKDSTGASPSAIPTTAYKEKTASAFGLGVGPSTTMCSASTWTGGNTSFSGSNVTITGNSCTKSTVTLSGDFEFQFVITSASGIDNAIGVYKASKTPDLGSYTGGVTSAGCCLLDINYGQVFDGATTTSVGTYSRTVGDTFKIKRVGTALTVYRNGTSCYVCTDFWSDDAKMLCGTYAGSTSTYNSIQYTTYSGSTTSSWNLTNGISGILSTGDSIIADGLTQIPTSIVQNGSLSNTSFGIGTAAVQTGMSNYTCRNIVIANSISSSGSGVKINFKASASLGLSLDSVYIGEGASTGNAYDFLSTPTKVTFNSGSSGFTIATSGTISSDTIQFSFDKTKKYIISFHVSNSGSGTNDSLAGRSGTNYWTRAGGDDSASITAASGYYQPGNNCEMVGIASIDVGTYTYTCTMSPSVSIPTTISKVLPATGVVANNTTSGLLSSGDEVYFKLVGSNSLIAAQPGSVTSQNNSSGSLVYATSSRWTTPGSITFSGTNLNNVGGMSNTIRTTNTDLTGDFSIQMTVGNRHASDPGEQDCWGVLLSTSAASMEGDTNHITKWQTTSGGWWFCFQTASQTSGINIYKGSSIVSTTTGVAGDVFKIVRTSGTYALWKNGTSIYTWASTGTAAMRMGMSHYWSDSYFNDLRDWGATSSYAYTLTNITPPSAANIIPERIYKVRNTKYNFGVVPSSYASLGTGSTDKNTNLTLSGSNLIVTQSASTINCSIRSATGMTSGKYYCEFKIGLAGMEFGLGASLSSVDHSSLNFPGSAVNSVGWPCWTNTFYKNASYSGSCGGAVTPSLNDIFGMAIDIDNQKIWYHRNGTWLNGVTTANVINGLNAHQTLVGAGTYNFGIHTYTANSVCTANFGSSAWSYTCPTGFVGLSTGSTSTSWQLTNASSGILTSNDSIFADGITRTVGGVSQSNNGTVVGNMNGITNWTNANGYTFVDVSWALPNNVTIYQIGLWSNGATSVKLKVLKRNSAVNYDVMYSQAVTPQSSTSSICWYTLPTPYTVPASGNYYIGGYFTGSPNVSAYNSATGSMRGYVASDVTGTGVTIAEDTGAMVVTRAIYGVTSYTYTCTSINPTPTSIPSVVSKYAPLTYLAPALSNETICKDTSITLGSMPTTVLASQMVQDSGTCTFGDGTIVCAANSGFRLNFDLTGDFDISFNWQSGSIMEIGVRTSPAPYGGTAGASIIQMNDGCFAIHSSGNYYGNGGSPDPVNPTGTALFAGELIRFYRTGSTIKVDRSGTLAHTYSVTSSAAMRFCGGANSGTISISNLKVGNGTTTSQIVTSQSYSLLPYIGPNVLNKALSITVDGVTSNITPSGTVTESTAGTEAIITSDTNQNDWQAPYANNSNYWGEAFQILSPYVITKASFMLAKLGSPPGTVCAKLYAVTGSFPTAYCTGSALAVSPTVNTSAITSSFVWFDFTFTTPYLATAGKWAVVLEYLLGDSSNYVRVGLDCNTNAYTNGNGVQTTPTGTHITYAQPTYDTTFKVWGYTPTYNTIIPITTQSSAPTAVSIKNKYATPSQIGSVTYVNSTPEVQVTCSPITLTSNSNLKNIALKLRGDFGKAKTISIATTQN